MIIGLGLSGGFSVSPPPLFRIPFDDPAPLGELWDGAPPLGAKDGSGFLAGFACIEGSVGDPLSLDRLLALTLPVLVRRTFLRMSRSRGWRRVTMRDLGENGFSNLGRFATAMGETSVFSRGRFAGLLDEPPAESVSVFFRSRGGFGAAVGVPWAVIESDRGIETEMLGRSDAGRAVEAGAGAGVEGGPDIEGRLTLMDEPRDRMTGLLGSVGGGAGTAMGAMGSGCVGLVR